MADRVRKVSQVFMAATIGCAQCHNHKFDPFAHKDFHTLGAFFADVEDEEHLVHQYGNLNTLPTRRLPEMPVYTPSQQQRLAKIGPRVEPALAQVQTLEGTVTSQKKAIADLEKKISAARQEAKANLAAQSSSLHSDLKTNVRLTGVEMARPIKAILA